MYSSYNERVTITHALSLLERGVWAINEVSEIAAITKLVLARQFSMNKGFTIYLIADVIRSFLLWWLAAASVSSSVYASLWLRSEPLLLAFQGFAVIELYLWLYRTYPGIGRFARSLILMAAAVAVSLSVITVSLDLREQWKHPDLQRMMFSKRLFSSLSAILLLVTLTWFPKARSARPLFEVGWLLSGLLGAAAIGYFVIDIMAPTRNNSVEIGTVTLGVQAFFLILWTFKRSPVPLESRATKTVDDEWDKLLKAARFIKKNGLE